MNLPDLYPDFKYSPNQLRKFIATSGVVTLLLMDGGIDHFTPKNISDFLNWLSAHHVEDLKAKFDVI
jgi:hypothetical protein